METLITIDELRRWRQECSGARVAFVPTMGALHEGHLSLVDRGKREADKVIASIFVNPTQFGPKEDFSTYPRTLEDDISLLTARGADAVFVPLAADIYPSGFQTYVVNDRMALGLCGASRVNHFRGVLTVVLKLFNLVNPDCAIFGKKDYQQWRLIEQMVRDFCLPLAIIGEEIMREKDGLAMSSRNRRLTAEERPIAAHLHKGLKAVHEKFLLGERKVSALTGAFNQTIKVFPAIAMEYLEVRTQEGLEPVTETIEGPSVMLLACRLGDVRLIDNIELDMPKS